MSTYDYIICGGGTVGCVLASRLSQAGHSVLLAEAGPEDYNELVMNPLGSALLHDTDFEYKFTATDQPHLGNRPVINHGGKLLSGSTAVNYGMWTRGHSRDYDAWAEHVGDERWNYQNMLPYLKATETHHTHTASSDIHGFAGPISTTMGKRDYPLREPLRNSLTEAGLIFNSDANNGHPFGFSFMTETWKNAQRQPAGKAYDLSKATIHTNSVVSRILIESNKATGITLVDGTEYRASKEVIVSCGALKTPQLLMLSGIGPKEHLEEHNIHTIADLPVGYNYHDHVAGSIFWKLKNSDQGLALGSPQFSNPQYLHGNTTDWVVTTSTPRDGLIAAAKADKIDPQDPYIREERANGEIIIYYAPIAGGGTQFSLPLDGQHIATLAVLLLPTSRGRVSLANTDPMSNPVVDPNYLATATDRAALRSTIRLAFKIMETDAAKEAIAGETPPPGHNALTSSCTDEDLDERIDIIGSSLYQNAGTAAMGTVVDSQCRVLGVRGLRVCDASVLPLPIAGHYQAPMYAMGEAVADIILNS
ncbi:hypothetical protein ASPWEDRAFT_41422 [Aspergillus wentii DTO 134E9]|uniref:Glucose-methanol-choline oxidoreductase N-terminal domain-containing protein n=1 Tax=Aspergillus wentii DTO 134E9 TaxID=1073089 RepID=A0A1L9RMQ3_ASPWE|nr:uncharacterized protein ASPWEDRAFT_41422 [Aspergillus wentii DTO 134E9]OJJ36211.1 hypothetical protein ASPWEDRAFT_41422 [Aspergillus wentii DTO 134E9]